MFEEYLLDIKRRYVCLKGLFSSLDFMITLTIIVLFSWSLISLSNYSDYLSIPLFLLILIVIYDFTVSFLIFNLKIFNVEKSSNSMLSSKFVEYLFTPIDSELDDKEKAIATEIKDKIENKIDSLLKRVFPRKFRKRLADDSFKVISFLKWFLSFFLIEKDFNSFIDKVLKSISYGVRKLIYGLLLIFKKLWRMLLTVLYTVLAISSVLFLVYVAMNISNKERVSSGDFEGGVISIFTDMMSFIGSITWLKYILLAGVILFLGYLAIKLVKYMISKIIAHIVLMIQLFKLAVISTIIGFIFVFIVQPVLLLLSTAALFLAGLISSLFVTISGSTFAIVDLISKDIFILLCLLAFFFLYTKGSAMRALSYIYLSVISLVLIIFTPFSVSIPFICLLIIWSMTQRFKLKAIYSAIVLGIGYLFPSIQGDLIRLAVVYFILITDYEVMAEDENQVSMKKDVYLDAVSGKYKTLKTNLLVSPQE